MTDEKINKLRKLLDSPSYMNNAINSIADSLLDGEKSLRIYKKCSRCKQLLSEDNFTYCCEARDKLSWWCRDCHRAYRAEKKDLGESR